MVTNLFSRYEEVADLLTNKRFKICTSGANPRWIRIWQIQNLLPDYILKRSGKQTDAVGIIWIKLLVKLKRFNLFDSASVPLMKALMLPVNLQDESWFARIEKEQRGLSPWASPNEISTMLLTARFAERNSGILRPYLFYILLGTILSDSQACLLVGEDGIIDFPEIIVNVGAENSGPELQQKTHVSICLNELLNQTLPDLKLECKNLRLQLITAAELSIIKEIRSGLCYTLQIYFDEHQKPVLVEPIKNKWINLSAMKIEYNLPWISDGKQASIVFRFIYYGENSTRFDLPGSFL